MRLTLSVRKTLEENASGYFEAAKKARKKLAGAKTAAAKATLKTQQPKKTVQKRKKEWYEQYRWTFSQDNTLIIGGKDATTNEVVIKKHLLPTDTVFHTDAAGSPFVIIKGAATSAAIEAAATLCAAYSKAWKAGISVADVFWVKPEQVSKTPNTGEYISKGSFIIRGEKHYVHPAVELSLGVREGKPAAGVPELFTAYATIQPGKEKTSDVAKKLAKKLGFTTDDWLSLLPAGGCVITRYKNSPEGKINHG